MCIRDSRISYLIDHDEYEEISSELKTKDWLSFTDTKKYKERLNDAKTNIDETEALISVHGKLNDKDVVLSVFEFRFLGGSMGSVVGQKFVDAVEFAIEKSCPFICVATSGGARMQESLFSLFLLIYSALRNRSSFYFQNSAYLYLFVHQAIAHL